MSGARRAGSLAARLIVLFALGSAAIMSAGGYALYHALGMQHQANDFANIEGKTQAVREILAGVRDDAGLEAALPRLRDLALGHRNLHIGVMAAGRWLAPPGDGVPAGAADAARGGDGAPVGAHAGNRSWLLQRVDRRLPSGAAQVVVALETTEGRELLREHAQLAALFAGFGTLLGAGLAWLVVRRGLAPLGQLAQRAEHVTAQRLGARLDLAEAPRELHGLADSINRMLERLEESFRALEQFSADIAHELRTPLNNLLLQTQVTLGRPRSAAEYQDALHSNLVEVERLRRMVSEMLFLARADRGMIELALEDVDLVAEAASVAEYFEAAAAENGQSIVVSGAAQARCDRSLARRAITNLLSNAVRYAPPGAAIAVEGSSDASQATLSVTNPGPEIGRAELQRLFGRFVRPDESRARSVEGTGLGLAIVDSIMKLQGGAVEARSEGGRLTFAIRFPRRAAG